MPSIPRNTSLMQKIGLILLGTVLGLILLETGLRVAGGVLTFIQEHQNRTTAHKKGTFRIMCIGESTTAIGGKNSYPRQLERILNGKDIGIDFRVINKGLTGKQTSVIMEELDENLQKYTPDMVVAMMGINDGRADVEVVPDPEGSMVVNFVKKCRIYKLINLLGLHMAYRTDGYQGGSRWNNSQLQGELVSTGITKDNKNKNPSDFQIDLARKLTDQGKYQKAEEILKSILESDHNNDRAYLELGLTYESDDMDQKASDMYRKAVEINGRNPLAQYKLGRILAEMKEYDEAEDRIRRAIEIAPSLFEAYIELGYVYLARKEYKKAHEIVSKGLKIDPSNNRGLGIIEIINKARGEGQGPNEYRVGENVTRRRFVNEMTYRNYEKLTRILAKKRIQLVSVQYPVRDVDSLKVLLDSADGVIFVDNETVFKDALKNSSYDELFTDLFAGDFGHCTEKGNNLLASNIAKVILQEYFGSKQKYN